MAKHRNSPFGGPATGPAPSAPSDSSPASEHVGNKQVSEKIKDTTRTVGNGVAVGAGVLAAAASVAPLAVAEKAEKKKEGVVNLVASEASFQLNKLLGIDNYSPAVRKNAVDLQVGKQAKAAAAQRRLPTSVVANNGDDGPEFGG